MCTATWNSFCERTRHFFYQSLAFPGKRVFPRILLRLQQRHSLCNWEAFLWWEFVGEDWRTVLISILSRTRTCLKGKTVVVKRWNEVSFFNSYKLTVTEIAIDFKELRVGRVLNSWRKQLYLYWRFHYIQALSIYWLAARTPCAWAWGFHIYSVSYLSVTLKETEMVIQLVSPKGCFLSTHWACFF